MNQGPVKTIIFLLACVTLAMAAAFAFSRYSHKAKTEFGILTGIDGRVEVRTSGTRQWLPPIEGDHLLDGTSVRVGTNGSAQIKAAGTNIHLGPDTELTLSATSGKPGQTNLRCQLHSGEVYVNSPPGDATIEFTTQFGAVKTLPDSHILLAQPAGQKFATVTVSQGSAQIINDGDPREIKALTGAALLDRAGRRGIWADSPGFEELFPGKENHEAVVFKWNGAHDDVTGNLLIRNLTTGEMTTHEGAKPGAEFTLPSGSYSWVVNAQGFMTSPRRFHIGGQVEQPEESQPHPANVTTEEAHEASGAEHVAPAQQAASPAPPEPTQEKLHETTPAPESAHEKPQVTAHEPTHEAAKKPEPETKPEMNPETKPEKKTAAEPEPPSHKTTDGGSTATAEPVKMQILAPKKESVISVSAIPETRVIWKTTGTPKSLELEVLGSSQNPSLHFTLEGHRTRQKLKLLPPGRYSVRLRAIQENGTPGEWSETFFDVIQTTAGELAPKDVSFMVNIPKNPGKIFIQWKKSAAPLYQIRVTSPGAPAHIERVKKSHVLISQPKSGKATVSICALDANGHIRGCAEDISVP